MTIVRVTISGNAEGITSEILNFAYLLDADFQRDVKWETIEDEVLVIPSPVIDQGPYKSEKIAIEVAERHGWQVDQDDFGYVAFMPNGKVADLLKSIRDWKSVYSWVADETLSPKDSA